MEKAITPSNNPGPSTIKPRSSRKSAPKVKTGCITCKIRHVKCDETKPDCQRCTSTGRKCDGYEHKKEPKIKEVKERRRSMSVATTTSSPDSTASALSPSNAIVQLGSPSISSAGQSIPARRASLALSSRPLSFQIFTNPSISLTSNPFEQRALKFFLENTGPMLSSRFKAGFWTNMLPRVASTEDCVMHAAMAIACVHEEQMSTTQQTESNNAMSLIQYNKAIASLRRRLMSPLKGDREVTVLTCLLFVCLELMRQTPERAFQHLQSGMKILTSLKLEVRPSSSEDSRSLDLLEHTDDEIVNSFSRLSIQQSLAGRDHPSADYMNMMVTMPSLTDHSPFQSIEKARDSLYDITMLSLRPDTNNPQKGVIPIAIPAPEFFEMRRTVIEQVGHWSDRLTTSMKTVFQSVDMNDMQSLRLLQLHSLLMLVWNETQLDWANELAFDSQIDRFREMITLSRAINDHELYKIAISSSSPPPPPSSSSASTTPSAPATLSKAFSLEMGPVYVLFVVAAKCRHPYVRREAIDLLLLIQPQQEGVWNAACLHAVSLRIMELEEDGQIVTDDPLTWPTAKRTCWYRMDDVYDLENRTQQISLGWRPDPLGGLIVWQELIHY